MIEQSITPITEVWAALQKRVQGLPGQENPLSLAMGDRRHVLSKVWHAAFGIPDSIEVPEPTLRVAESDTAYVTSLRAFALMLSSVPGNRFPKAALVVG
jgi:hypothetical protein